MTTPYVNSAYPRRPDDNYHTVDPRCLHALLDTWEITGTIVDCCSRNGSALMEQLADLGRPANLNRPGWIAPMADSDQMEG